MAQIALPQRIRRLPHAVEIAWDEAHVGRFDARSLRLACPCAACVDEFTGRPLLDPATVPDDVSADSIELVGAYAIRVRWTDGHGTGMQTFEWLAAHCPCPACIANRSGDLA